MKSHAGKKWPFPEILDGEKPYILKETPKRSGMVCTDLVGKVMFVPTTDDANGRMSRRHEMAHVAISPSDAVEQAAKLGIEHDYLNAAEDMRVNIFLCKNFKTQESLPQDIFKHTLEGFVLTDDLKNFTLMAVVCYGLPEMSIVRGVLHEKSDWYYEVLDPVENCRNIMDLPSFENALKAAAYLQSLFDKSFDGLGDIPRGVIESVNRFGSDDNVEWGIMEEFHPPLTERLPERRLNRRVKPQDMGSSMMFPSRLDVDDKVFGTMKRVSKGTVLIDVSASMQLAQEDIKEMIKSCPGVTVACYSGRGNGTGHLTILASKGAMMKLEPDHYWPGSNEVDGPALEWLAKQPEPRLWVCDGMVTGIGDSSSKRLVQEAYTIVKNNNIRRVPEIEDTVNFLKK